ncbi:hypothetical protein AAG906_027968 [Vitis piasezkii]
MTPRDFFYPRVALDFYQSMTTRRVRNPNVIHFTIDGRHAPPQMESFNGLCCTPRAPDMPAPPEPPQDEQPPQAQQAEIPTEIISPAPTTPSIVPTPEATSSAPLTILEAPPVVPATSAPPPSESSITISTSEFRGLCHTLQTLSTTQGVLFQQMAIIRAHQDQLIAMQTQHTAILSQIQQHLESTPSEEATPAEQTMPHEETTTAKVETSIQSTQETTAEPSSPHDPPTTT